MILLQKHQQSCLREMLESQTLPSNENATTQRNNWKKRESLNPLFLRLWRKNQSRLFPAKRLLPDNIFNEFQK